MNVTALRRVSQVDFENNEEERVQFLQEAQRLCSRLETPMESVKRMTYEEPTLNMAIRIAHELQIFKNLGSCGSPAKTVVELASYTQAEPELVERVLRHCAAKSVITEKDDNTYEATTLSEVLATDQGMSGIHSAALQFWPAFKEAPEYLRSTGFKVPRDGTDTTHQHSSLGTVGESHFEWIKKPENERIAENFNLLMRLGGTGNYTWADAYPANELIQGLEPSRPLMVDVGGGLGHHALDFKRKNDHLPGKYIVQDMPNVVAQAMREDKTQELEYQEYDLFKPQHVKGAKIYFMGRILHDWADEDAHTILQNTVSAMKPGYSSLVLREKVLPDTDCPPLLSAVDLIMMAEFGAHERTSKQWASLFAPHGLKLDRIIPIPGEADSVLVATL